MALVTISGGMGCGVEEIARLVGAKAKLAVYDDWRLHEEAVRMGIRSEDLKGVDEKAPGFFDSLLHDSELYRDVLESVVYAISRAGQGILVGHGSQVLLRDFGCALHVFVHASDAYRIRRIAHAHGMSPEGAEKMLRKSDGERRGFLRFAFQMDWSDLSLYDLVVNTEKLGVHGAAELLSQALDLPAIDECSLHALEAMERMALLKKVQAALHRARLGFQTFTHVEVPEPGLVQITGFLHSQEDRMRMVEVIQGIPGVVKVKDELKTIPVSGA